MNQVISKSTLREEVQRFSEFWWEETGLTVEDELREGNIVNFAMSILEKFGSNITMLPISVTPFSTTDRLPSDSDCNENKECWVSKSPGLKWELRCVKYDNAYDYWLPFKVLPFPLPVNFDEDHIRFTYKDASGNDVPASVSKKEAGKLLSDLLEFKSQTLRALDKVENSLL